MCRKVTRAEVAAHNYSLNPKVYIEPPASEAGHAGQAIRISESIDEIQESVALVTESISERLSHPLPLDRGILVDAAKILYRKWFVNGDAKEAPQEHSEEDLFEEWDTRPFREVVAKYIGGGWGKEEPDEQHTSRVRIIRGTDMDNVRFGECHTCPVRFVKPTQLASRRLMPGDIVIEVSGGGKEQSTGRTVVISDALLAASDEPLICASFCKMVRLDEDVLASSIGYFYLQHLYDEKLIERFEVQSTGIKNFKFELFLDKAEIAVPPEAIQERFDRVVGDMLRLVHLLGTQRSLVRALAALVPPKDPSLSGLATLDVL